MTAIKFSIVIPTRDRAEYLASCLASVVKAAERSGTEVEIVVSDNASTDDTESTVKAATYPGIKYVRRPERLSMRQNFEEALLDTTGSHVIFIGDDDAVLPNGLKVLGDFIRTTGADAINWPVLNFLWPDPKFDAPGSLKIAPYKLSGRYHKVDVAGAYRKILDGTYRSYHSGIVSYHGCVSREVIETGRERCQGTYFWCSSPDVFSSIRNLMIEDVSYWKFNMPITLGGASPRSNGRSSQRLGRRDEGDDGAEIKKFIKESENDPFNGALTPNIFSHALITLDALLMALKVQGRSDQINTNAWRDRIQSEIADIAPEFRQENADLAAKLLDVPVSVPDAPAPKPSPVAIHQSSPLKGWPVRTRLIGTKAMQEVEGAAAILDAVCGMEGFDMARNGALARAARIWQSAKRLRDAATASG